MISDIIRIDVIQIDRIVKQKGRQSIVDGRSQDKNKMLGTKKIRVSIIDRNI